MLSKARPIIALISDLSSTDPYVAEMKGVILSICPEATIVDITHEVRKFDVRMGAFILSSTAPFFPKGTIFVCVVDPGVGTKRRILAIKTRQGRFFIGPDNGLLIPASLREGIEVVIGLERREYTLPKVSPTFHGRDIMAPAAAYLAKGKRLRDLGRVVLRYVKPRFAQARVEKGRIIGEVLHIDSFGNVVTNVEGAMVRRFVSEGGALSIKIGKKSLSLRFRKTYADASPKEFLALVGSSGYLEVAANQASAADFTGARVGDSIKIQVPKSH